MNQQVTGQNDIRLNTLSMWYEFRIVIENN